MPHRFKKIIGYMSILSLLNATCAPLYAQGGGYNSDHEDDLNMPRHISRQKPKDFEERAQGWASSLADKVSSWIPQRVKSYLNTLGEEVVPLVNGKTPLELDYSDPTFWEALFETELK